MAGVGRIVGMGFCEVTRKFFNDMARGVEDFQDKLADALGQGGPHLAMAGAGDAGRFGRRAEDAAREDAKRPVQMNIGKKNKSNDDDDGSLSWLPRRKSDESDHKPGKAGTTCNYCDGNKTDPYKDNRTCPNCNGTGLNPN